MWAPVVCAPSSTTLGSIEPAQHVVFPPFAHPWATVSAAGCRCPAPTGLLKLHFMALLRPAQCLSSPLRLTASSALHTSPTRAHSWKESPLEGGLPLAALSHLLDRCLEVTLDTISISESAAPPDQGLPGSPRTPSRLSSRSFCCPPSPCPRHASAVPAQRPPEPPGQRFPGQRSALETEQTDVPGP